MADTKSLSREDRKKSKRSARKSLKALHLALSTKDRKVMRKADEKVGIKHYLNEKARKAAQE